MAQDNPFVASFGHALRGIAVASRGRNFRVMFTVAVAVVALAAAYAVSGRDWAILVLCIGAVLCAEAINTAVERMADAIRPDPHPMIRDVKDVAAGAVLLLSVAAAIAGVVVFWPYVTG
jgi:diacylglycerol kinase